MLTEALGTMTTMFVAAGSMERRVPETIMLPPGVKVWVPTTNSEAVPSVEMGSPNVIRFPPDGISDCTLTVLTAKGPTGDGEGGSPGSIGSKGSVGSAADTVTGLDACTIVYIELDASSVESIGL